MKATDTTPRKIPAWIPLTTSIAFILKHVRILGWSLLLVALTGLLTWLGYVESLDLINGLAAPYFQTPPEYTGVWGWIAAKGWVVLKFLFFIIVRIVAFYLSFLVAYTLTAPGYAFLSTSTEKIYLGSAFTDEDGFTISGVLRDLVEGCKIGLLGLLVTVAALVAGFIPVIGFAAVLFIYIFYSALMFLDYPASRHRWTLGRKIEWVRTYYRRAFRLGALPALISMVPVVNIFFMALLFPLFTVHTTLNFLAIEEKK
jgi:CysZ protein